MLLTHKRADRVSTVRVQEALRDKGYASGHTDGRYGMTTNLIQQVELMTICSQ